MTEASQLGPDAEALRIAFDRLGDGHLNEAWLDRFAQELHGLVEMCRKLDELDLEPMGYLVGWATAGVHPAYMGIGPVPSVSKLMTKINMSLEDMDVIELNEAFAAQAISVNRDMGWDTDKVNVNGGAIAMGHPLGATGGMILGTMVDELERSGKETALVTLCVGAGMGTATIIERV